MKNCVSVARCLPHFVANTFDTSGPSSDISRQSGLLKQATGFNVRTQVSLFFPTDRFEEVAQDRNWIMGRRGNNYVAVWRHAVTQNDCRASGGGACDPYYYSDPNDGIRAQVWAVVVGNRDTHSSFTEFSRIVGEGAVVEKKRFSLWATQRTEYRTEVVVDGKRIVSTLR
jgi:hypothetical protein